MSQPGLVNRSHMDPGAGHLLDGVFGNQSLDQKGFSCSAANLSIHDDNLPSLDF